MHAPLQCPRCRAWLLEQVFNRSEPVPCPACGVPLQAEVFPAFFRSRPPVQSGEAVLVAGEAGCFYHPQKKAVVPCAGCGRFLCALCDCEWQGKHFCPACLEAGRTKGHIQGLEQQRTLYDSIALSLAILPLLLFYFTILTAPMALFVALRYWNAPRSLVHRSRFRYVAAMCLASLQMAGWGFLVLKLTHHLPR